jgi:hypothetical protein
MRILKLLPLLALLGLAASAVVLEAGVAVGPAHPLHWVPGH